MKRLGLAALFFVMASSPGGAVSLFAGATTPSANASLIADLVNTYLAESSGAPDSGGWFDASPAGTAPDRGQHLMRPSSFPTVVPTPPGQVQITALSNTTEVALVTFDDGAGGSGTLTAFLSQFQATHTDANGSTAFDTFCIDLMHTLSAGQTYAVTLRADLDTAFSNGARMAYIMAHFGDADLSANPIQAAAVQIALWDLSLDAHNPTSFQLGDDGSYSSGDGVFTVFFAAVAVSAPSSWSIFCGAVLVFLALGLWAHHYADLHTGSSRLS